MSIVGRFFWALVLSGTVSLPAAGVGAYCTCGLQPCNAILGAAAVFEATIESAELMPATPGMNRGYRYLSVALKDVTPLRGNVEPVVLTAPGESSCGYEFEIGRRYLIHGYRGRAGGLWTGLCTRTQPIEQARGLIEYLRGVDDRPDQSMVWGRALILQDVAAARRRDLVRGYSPIEAAHISFRGPRELSIETDKEGRFAFTGLPYGSYTVSVTLPEHLTFLTVREPFEVELKAPHGCADLRFVAR